MSQHDRYISPFSTRYASDEMQYIFSDDNKFRTWRRLWVALARAEMNQGLDNITPAMIAELESHLDDINYDVASAREKLVRHDVMSHVYAYGQQCPQAAGIIHLGATSCYVGDNTDIIVMRQGLELVRTKLVGVLAKLARFAREYKDMPCLAYTHGQPAQPTTVGKRATLWANELVMDLGEIEHRLETLQLRGVKGTTGTQASFMELFKGDADKIRAVDAEIAKEMGFDPSAVIPVSGQTYSRKVDAFILNALAGIGQSCMKFATDLRLLANFKEMEEPFEKNQIGSSAMPYKRNPMRCERICALSRYLMADVLNPSFTAGTQWFERTLDDSANKRVAMAEGFLATDAILNIMLNVTDGLVVYPKVVRSRLMAELPFMASENIMMQAVEKGGNRQELHERLRQHAIAAGKQVKEEGLPNDMVERIAGDPAFGLTREEIEAGFIPENFVGRAPQQVEEFLANILQPIFARYPEALDQNADLSV
ncbi:MULTISPECIES: adenylosuccinate lyase [unclassified Faecalibacterium]|uniref:adenylosuccinate lyase n=1 Tax=unclassified Faecalibacterium TaxID=2646395 RepID=UPI000B3A559E|nr:MULTISPECIES: adenylosuccinate lyase [unclassified Faecalibacterium]OUP28321.1 adenylosuccinate lyase [Faecalibacterium sp. An192]OUQ36498.1 adenylosuccinate lyase [Faecalibacterium sp. An122]